MGAPFIRRSNPLVYRAHPDTDVHNFFFKKKVLEEWGTKNMNLPEILAEYSHRQESRAVSSPEVGLEPTTSALEEQALYH